MKHYTILEDGNENIMIVLTSQICEVIYLNNEIDNTYIWKHGELVPTLGHYPIEFIKDGHPVYVEEDGEYKQIEVSELYPTGKMVYREYGTTVEQIIFDAEDDDDGWKSVAEVDASRTTEHEENIDRCQQLTMVYHCDNGWRIREYVPYTYEYPAKYERID